MKNYVFPSCRKVMHHFGDQLEISNRLGLLFGIAWWSDPESFTDRALSGLQMLSCLSRSPAVLHKLAMSLWHTGASDAFNAKVQGHGRFLAAVQGESMTDNDRARRALVRDCFQFWKQILRTALHETKLPSLQSEIASDLAELLEEGCVGVEADPREAVILYRRAIEEGGNITAMNNLALILKSGGEVVEADQREAVEEGNDVDAMNILASLLEAGGDGMEADAREAVALYERAINEGDLIDAMYGLARLLEAGGDGVDADEERAAMLYEQAGVFRDARERDWRRCGQGKDRRCWKLSRVVAAAFGLADLGVFPLLAVVEA